MLQHPLSLSHQLGIGRGDHCCRVADGQGLVLLKQHLSRGQQGRLTELIDVCRDGAHRGVVTRDQLLHDEAVPEAGVLDPSEDVNELLRCVYLVDLVLTLEAQSFVGRTDGWFGHHRKGQVHGLRGPLRIISAGEVLDQRARGRDAQLVAHPVELDLVGDHVQHLRIDRRHDIPLRQPLRLVAQHPGERVCVGQQKRRPASGFALEALSFELVERVLPLSVVPEFDGLDEPRVRDRAGHDA